MYTGITVLERTSVFQVGWGMCIGVRNREMICLSSLKAQENCFLGLLSPLDGCKGNRPGADAVLQNVCSFFGGRVNALDFGSIC